jgi:hypothetical protein
MADRLGNALMVSANHLAQIFGIEPRGQGCRVDEIAEHYCELAAFGIAPMRYVGGPRGGRHNRRRGTKRGDGVQQSSAGAPPASRRNL